MSKSNEYIWYCPRPSCNAIVFKTTKPFITDGIFKCRRCNEPITAERLMKENKKNIKRYLDS